MKFALALGAAAMAVTAHSAFAQTLKYEPGADDRFDWASYEALKGIDLAGETISVFGPWLSEEKDLVESVFDYFEAATGATVEYAGSDSLEQQIVIDTQAGSAPNLTAFPQPGLAANLAAKGFLAPLDDATRDWVKDNYAAGQSWVDLGTYANDKGEKHFYGFFYKVDVKSLVWYVPENFEDAGYEVPQTMEELKALTEQIVEDGGTPWCIGLGSGGATGWPATDWVEDLMLRTQPPEVYDQWVTNEIPFDDPKVVGAIEEFGWFAKNDTFVDGGAAAVASTDFRDSPGGLFASPPKCYLHRQASFVPAFFPEGTELGADADFFYFPAYEIEGPRQAGSRLRKRVRDHQGFQGRPRAYRIPQDADRARDLDGTSGFPDATQKRQPGGLRQRDAEKAGRNPDRCDHLSLRRVRPDAGQDRRRRFLDRHDRLCRRQTGDGGRR